MVRRRPKKRRPSRKRTVRSSKSGPTDNAKVKRPILDDPVDDLCQANGDSDNDYVVSTSAQESYVKAMELVAILRSNEFGLLSNTDRVKKLLAVIDARFRELMLTRAMSSRSRRRVTDLNQTSLFDQPELYGEKHD